MEYTQEELDLMLQKEGDRRVSSAQKKWEDDMIRRLELEKDKWKQDEQEKATLTATELAEKKLKEEMDKIKGRETELLKRENHIKAVEMFSQADVPRDSYEKLLPTFITGDFETTKTNVELFIDVFNTTRTGLETKLKTELSKVPSPEIGARAGAKKFKDMTVEERMDLKEKNPDAFYKEVENSKSEFSF